MLRRRKVIVHFHIFKNAGSSIDRVLEDSFGKRWVTYDKEKPSAKITAAEMDDFLRANPKVQAVSSHQVSPPASSRVADTFPIVLLRHPIDRAYSAYLFEWGKQRLVKVPEAPFAQYVEEKFQHPRVTAIEDYQVQHLANTLYDGFEITPHSPAEVVVEQAKAFIDGLPCFGIVEEYGRSLSWFARVMGPHFPKLQMREVRVNSLQDASLTLADKLGRIKDELGAEAYAEMEARNSMDLALYEHALARFEG